MSLGTENTEPIVCYASTYMLVYRPIELVSLPGGAALLQTAQFTHNKERKLAPCRRLRSITVCLRN